MSWDSRHGDEALRKLMELGGEDESLAELVTIALEHLPYRQDERVAGALLLSILFHDDLSETLNGRL